MFVTQSTPMATMSLLTPLKFDVQTEAFVFLPSLPTDSRDADAAIMCTGSRYAYAPFYRGSVNTGDGDTALTFTSDGSYYVRVVWCTSTPLFGWCLRYFISYLQSLSSTPITRCR